MTVSLLETFKCTDNDKQKHDASSKGSIALSVPPNFPRLPNTPNPYVLQKPRGLPGPHSFSSCSRYSSGNVHLFLDKIFSWHKSWGFEKSIGMESRCHLRTHHCLNPPKKFRILGAAHPGSVPI